MFHFYFNVMQFIQYITIMTPTGDFLEKIRLQTLLHRS